MSKHRRHQPINMFVAAASPAAQNVHHTHHTTIEEHRAPTDESIRLAQEMMDRSREAILAAIPVASNKLQAKILIENYPATWSSKITVLLTLNGHRYNIEIDSDSLDLSRKAGDPVDDPIDTVVKRIIAKTAEAIAWEAIAESFQSNNRLPEALKTLCQRR